jgi:uncharacterized protein
MTALFADTFYWIALADFSDGAHQRALALTAQLGASPGPLRREAAESVEGILASSAIRVIPQSRESFLAGLQLFRVRPDKGYSLTDCISMQAMRKERLTDVLTNDQHFEQEGFRALFRDQ